MSKESEEKTDPEIKIESICECEHIDCHCTCNHEGQCGQCPENAMSRAMDLGDI